MNFIQYIKQVWKAGTSGGTPLSPDRLNHIEDGIKNNNNMISELNNNNITNNICTNLLNPTLETSSQNGITCTNNGDGTYTLNGTATKSTFFYLGIYSSKANKTYKILGWGNTKYEQNLTGLYIQVKDGRPNVFDSNGNGGFYTPASDESLNVVIAINNGTTISNAIIKPMITTNLNATYNDFVSYTGNTGRLNADVALLENKINKYFININETIYIPLRTMLLIYETAFDMGAYVVRSEAGNTKMFLHSIKENSKVNIGLGDNGKIKITNTANVGGDILTIVY